MVKSISVRPLGPAKERAGSIQLKESQESLRSNRSNRFAKENAEDVFIAEQVAKGAWEKVRDYLAEDPSRTHLADQKGKTVLHHAAEKGETKIIELVLSVGADIDQKDAEGNTALHLAATSGMKEAVQLLMDNSATVDIHNNKKLGPLHCAIDCEHDEILELMCQYKRTGVDFLTGCGATALVFATWKNSKRATKALLDARADYTAQCHKGITAFHIAALQGSHEVMKLFLDFVEENLIQPNTLLAPDNENTTPLHSSISSGDIEAVKVCLKAGGDISIMQNDMTTPLHLACAKGSVEMVKTLLESGKQNRSFFNDISSYLDLRDGMEMTPLHHAAIFDHVELCRFLIEQGSDINAQDCELRTPLFLAALKMATNVIHFLLAQGADVSIRNKQRKNFIHAAVISNCRLESLGNVAKYGDLLSQKDDNGCTPLHYASQLGLLRSMETLISTGVALNPKTKLKESPLHFAARYGRYNTCRKLLNSKEGWHLVNDADGHYQSALHMAAENGHQKVVQLLMKAGAVIQRDVHGNTPLHFAAKNGYTHTLKAILDVHEHVLNAQNSDGDTALHLAAVAGHTSSTVMLLDAGAAFLLNDKGESYLDLALLKKHSDVALGTVRHDRWEELFSVGSQTYGCFIQGFIVELPDICPIVFDRMIKCELDEDGHAVTTYNFRHLQMNMKVQLERRQRGDKIYPLPAANRMVNSNRVELLDHPLMVEYLDMKWHAIGLPLYALDVFIYVIFLAALTCFVTSFPNWEHTDNLVGNSTSVYGYFYEKYSYKFTFHYGHMIAHVVIVVFCFLNMIKEFIQMSQQKMKYLFDVSNYIEWILYISCTMFILPSITMGVSTHFQWECGAIATFLAWVNLLLFFQRSGRFGIYVVMFMEILKTLLEVIIVFFVLFVAFGLTFYIVLSNKTNTENGQTTVGMMLLRSAMMMLGDYDFKETFLYPLTDNDIETLHFAPLTMMLLVVFILLMPILLMNLLIGLAVGDIESIQRNAKLKRVAMQVELQTDLEKKLPAFFLRRVDKDEVVVKPCMLGMCRSVFHKLTSTKGGSCSGDEVRKDSYVYQELFKQKQRMKEFSNTLDKTFNLVRLMVQKMEIKTEEERDEGFTPQEGWQAALSKQKLKMAVMAKIKQ